MNRNRARELAPVIQAYGNGVMVQLRRVGAKWSNIWEDLGSTANFEDESVEWRIKPEPREFWVAAEKRFIDGSIEFSADLYPAERCTRPYGAIKVREVLDDGE